MDVAITKISSKGQVVIPSEMRRGLHKGDKLLLIKNDNLLIMKKATKLDKTLKAELDFARKTEEAWRSYERGEFKSMDAKSFLKELERW